MDSLAWPVPAGMGGLLRPERVYSVDSKGMCCDWFVHGTRTRICIEMLLSDLSFFVAVLPHYLRSPRCPHGRVFSSPRTLGRLTKTTRSTPARLARRSCRGASLLWLSPIRLFSLWLCLDVFLLCSASVCSRAFEGLLLLLLLRSKLIRLTNSAPRFSLLSCLLVAANRHSSVLLLSGRLLPAATAPRCAALSTERSPARPWPRPPRLLIDRSLLLARLLLFLVLSLFMFASVCLCLLMFVFVFVCLSFALFFPFCFVWNEYKYIYI